MNRDAIESALAQGLLSVRMNNGNAWKLRRNGRTQTWKTRPDWYRIPVKAGLRVYDEITHESTFLPTDNGYVLV